MNTIKANDKDLQFSPAAFILKLCDSNIVDNASDDDTSEINSDDDDKEIGLNHWFMKIYQQH